MDQNVPNQTKKLIIAVLFASFLILCEIVVSYRIQKILPGPAGIAEQPILTTTTDKATLLAFGDINLGRKVGQRILSGAINHPFERINLRDDSADMVFMNLESQLSEQNGETVSPMSNIVFTGPPQGAKTLKNAGVTIVSTANNHALDYGKKALFETIDNLRSENILFAGTSKNKDSLFLPLLIEENSIKFAIFAVTSFVNFSPKGWRDLVASADTSRLSDAIRRIRASVDVVIVSYHGGLEYVEAPVKETIGFARWCLSNNVDLFIGHHPHVTFGIEKYGEKLIVHSLGNFIFYQPQHYWTQRSYGVKILFEKRDSMVRISVEKIIPITVGFQTRRMVDSMEMYKLRRRTQRLSNFDLTNYWN